MFLTLLFALLIGAIGVAITNLVTRSDDGRKIGYILSVIVAVMYFFGLLGFPRF